MACGLWEVHRLNSKEIQINTADATFIAIPPTMHDRASKLEWRSMVVHAPSKQGIADSGDKIVQKVGRNSIYSFWNTQPFVFVTPDHTL